MLHDLGAIRAANPLSSIVGETVKLKRAGKGWKGCCPFHADRTPSFTIYADGEKFKCFGCGAQGNVFDYVQRLHGVEFIEAVELLGVGDQPSVHVAPLQVANVTDRTDEARAIWCAAKPILGTLGEAYLRSRGLHSLPPDALRFASLRYGRSGSEYPVLVAAVTGPDDAVCGIQRTFLRADGMGKAAVPKPKLSLGRVAGGAIRLAPCSAFLVVCEGLEDGLSLQQQISYGVWVAAGASMLPAIQFPTEVRSVTVGGDNDDAGRAAARAAGVPSKPDCAPTIFIRRLKATLASTAS